MTEVTTKCRKSDDSRARILEAARVLFSKNGYDRATVRDIAEAASINPSLVIRYYGSKELLFAEVVTLRFDAEPLVGLASEEIGEALVRHVMDRWESPRYGATLAALMRAAISSGAAQLRINAMFSEQLQSVIKAVGVDERSPETGALIATQMLGLGLARYVMKIPSVVALPRETIIAQVGRVVQQYIDAALTR